MFDKIDTVVKIKETYLVNNMFYVPEDSGNSEYLRIKEWIAEGNTPEVYQEPEPTYQELRQAEYPPLTDQLDMLFWDRINGTKIWADTIAAIKAEYPKPETVS